MKKKKKKKKRRGGRGRYLLPSNTAPGRAFPLKREAAGPQGGREEPEDRSTVTSRGKRGREK